MFTGVFLVGLMFLIILSLSLVFTTEDIAGIKKYIISKWRK